MRIFVSGKYEDRFNIRILQGRLQSMGHKIVEDWTYHEYTDKGYPVEYAEDDIKGVKKCDVYVGRFIADYNYKGSLTELGIALVLNKEVCVIGHAIDDNIFVNLCKRYDNEEQFLEDYK